MGNFICNCNLTFFFSLLKSKSAIEIDKRHPLGWTPLHVAVINKNKE